MRKIMSLQPVERVLLDGDNGFEKAVLKLRKEGYNLIDVQRQEIAHLMRVSMLGELSGGLAHELTQPLTAILSNAQAGKMLLAKGNRALSEIGNILDDIIAEDERAGEVIHRLRGMLKKGDVAPPGPVAR